MFKSNKKLNIKLLLILLVAFLLRFYGINWDNGLHLHPDERMIIMVADRIQFFTNLNPEFFNYGSFPIYLLKGSAQLIDLFFSSNVATYQGLLYLGRILSILFDLGTVFLIYKLTRLLFSSIKHPSSIIYYLSSFFYALAFFPIQNAHFFTVDTLFTFLTTLLVYTLLLYVKKPSSRHIVFLSIIFAALFATKFTAIIFLPAILFVVYIKKGFLSIIYHLLSIILFLFIFMPFAFLDVSKFWSDISAQLAMSKNAYIFPYTLQYVGTTPYWYYLKNIFLWGLGPIISILALFGLWSLISSKLKNKNLFFSISSKYFLFFIFYIPYFVVIGLSAVKFMRYMLPLYPFFAILAGYGIYRIQNSKFRIHNLVTYGLIILSIFWTLMFVSIYSQPNTRITATEWILKNISSGSTLAIEHWDDRLPIYGGELYKFQELTLYDQPDGENKWRMLNQKLKESDYIIIASNRLYSPLQKLADCSRYKVCYPRTAEYYVKLFRGELPFKKVAEFSNHPLFIDDQSADESFTVYDHPKIMIFKKTF